MKLKYDKESDSLIVIFKQSEIDESEEIRSGVIADFDKDGSIVSIEVLNASKKIESLNEITYNFGLVS
jgi:uncharacterized protein YuzE